VHTAKITLGAFAASHRAVRPANFRTVGCESSQYLNNLIEQDHRRVKQRIRQMLGFKRFDHAAVAISGNRIGSENQEDTQYNTAPRTSALS
jgi:transposase-like protein